MTLDQVLQGVLDHWGSISALLALVLSEALSFTKGDAAKGIIHGLLRALGKDAAKAAILIPVAFLAALPGCAFCKDAANAAVPRCVLEANMVKCGEQSGFALVPFVLGLIADAIAGQPFDASKLESDLIAQGVKDVPCVLAALEDYLATSALLKAGDPATLLLGGQIHAALQAALAKRGAHGPMKIQLRGGHVVRVDVP